MGIMNYGAFLMMCNAGLIPSTVSVYHPEQEEQGSGGIVKF